MTELIDRTYQSVAVPVYPELRPLPGNTSSRQAALLRHQQAIQGALASSTDESILVVGHGATHDFVTEALCPKQHRRAFQSPAWVAHCGITEVVEEEGDWRLARFGATPLVAPVRMQSPPKGFPKSELPVRPPTALPQVVKLPHSKGSAFYRGLISHRAFGEGVMVSLVLFEEVQSCCQFRGEWSSAAAEGKSERATVAVDFGITIAMQSAASGMTFLRGEFDEQGSISGECFQDGVGGGSFHLMPVLPMRVEFTDTDGDHLAFILLSSGDVAEYCNGKVVNAKLRDIAFDPASGLVDDGTGEFVVPSEVRLRFLQDLTSILLGAGCPISFGKRSRSSTAASKERPYSAKPRPGPGASTPWQRTWQRPLDGSDRKAWPWAKSTPKVPLPKGTDWPKEAKAREVAQKLFKDIGTSRREALQERRHIYRGVCLSWHPDKNPDQQALATEIFQFLQSLKSWYLGS